MSNGANIDGREGSSEELGTIWEGKLGRIWARGHAQLEERGVVRILE
jgi:hypothetical protein